MRKAMSMVAEFHRKHGAPVMERVATAEEIEARRDLRLMLIEEETLELAEALCKPIDVVAVADALADLAYVTIGAALEWGIPLDRVFAEVHRSNMTKTPGTVRGDGKILKGEGYEPPRIGEVLYPDKCCSCGSIHSASAPPFSPFDRVTVNGEAATVREWSVYGGPMWVRVQFDKRDGDGMPRRENFDPCQLVKIDGGSNG